MILLFHRAASAENTVALQPKQVLIIEVNDAIGPATAEYILSGLEVAAKQGSHAVIIQLDTPGGLDSAMRDIIKAILASPVAVITYVAPSGARAASAGTYILYASAIAAMAPGTNMGAATPVSLGGKGATKPQNTTSGQDKNHQAGATDMQNKIKNDATAYMRSLAEIHGRNIDWAKKAIVTSDSITAKKALQLGVIDVIAGDITSLLQQINGKTVTTANLNIKLNTSNTSLQYYQPSWRITLLSTITNPSIAYVLLLIGLYCLFFEFTHPGMIAPGVVGAIALLVALYALQLLPINYAALALILLGMAFIAGEAFISSFGALGVGGIVAFILGSIMLMPTNTPGMGISWTVITIMVIINTIIIFSIVGLALRTCFLPMVTGQDKMLGSTGIMREDCSDKGWLNYEGEIWQCQCKTPLKKGQKVKIIKIKNLLLHVEPIDS